MRIVKGHRYIFVFLVFFMFSCSSKKNTFLSRNYHALTTHYNVYFNGNESLKDGIRKIKSNTVNNYTEILPIFEYQNTESRTSAFGDMDRAILKANKAIKLHSITSKPKRKKGDKSAKYLNFRKKKEYNNWIDDCYLLLADGEFYKKEYMKAEKHYKFIFKQFPKSNLRSQAQIGIARLYTDRGRSSQAKDILARISGANRLDKKQEKEIKALYARIHLLENNIPSSIDNLKSAIKLSSNKSEKARFYYIMAQLYLEIGNKDMAVNSFNKTIKLSPSYDMVFNAKISTALAYSSNNSGISLRNSLIKMLKDGKNQMFKDQIYFAIAEMDMADKKEKDAIENYWKSTSYSLENDNQKALSFLKLADIYFAKRNYNKAQMCYDSSMVYIDHEYKDYEFISEKVSNLTDLVVNLNTVDRQDSLQRVAKLPIKERDKIIKSIIKKITDTEIAQRNDENDLRKDRNFFLRNKLVGRSGNSTNSSGGGNWYFYNPTTVGMGKSEFKRKWGRRKLEDNWRRKNKVILEIINDKVDDNIEEDNEIVDKKGNPKTAAFYIADLPTSKKAIDKSNDKIIKSLYLAAVVYQEKMNKNTEALKTLDILTKRFPENKYLLDSYYRSYIMLRTLNKFSEAKYYSDIIIRDYADSDYAKALLDPSFYDKLDQEKQKINQLYEQVFNNYNNYYFLKVIDQCDKAILLYKESKLIPKFSFLRAMAIGRTDTESKFVKSLKDVLLLDLSDELKETCESILESIENGSTTLTYSKSDMSSARQEKVSRNWNFNTESKNSSYDNPVKKIKNTNKSTFDSNIAGKQLFAVYFSEKDLNPSLLVFGITSYNVDTYNNRTFDVKIKKMSDNKVLVLVDGLKDKTDAIAYFDGIRKSKKAFKRLAKIDYLNFIITKNNLNTLLVNEDVDKYLSFYTKVYFNIESTVDIKKVDKISSENIENNKSTKKNSKGFVMDKDENHKLVLVVPTSSVDTRSIRNIIYAHDKDYDVVVDSYDANKDIIIVNNLGPRRDAINYLLGIVKDKNVFEPLADIKYFNFIISETNFYKFLKQRKLDEYMEFYRENYIKFLTIDNTETAKLKSIYNYQEETMHYFALIYSKKNVDSVKLKKGIEAYNKGDFDIEILPFGNDADVLLVKNMKNTKQALLYYRAFASNTNLLAPLKGKHFSYFVISHSNYKILYKEKQIPDYVYFFKYSYLN